MKQLKRKIKFNDIHQFINKLQKKSIKYLSINIKTIQTNGKKIDIEIERSIK